MTSTHLGLVLTLVVACASHPEPRTSIDGEDRCASLRVPAPLKHPAVPGDPDADDDCIPDAFDHCPNEPEDHDYFEPDDGCPDPDNDGDGVLDVADMCPDVAGVPSNNGCPAK